MKTFEGIVVSKGMNKTVVVEVFRRTPHPLYKKLIKRSKKLKADNTGFEIAEVGNRVKITETRPISKDKYFKISQILAGKVILKKKDETAVVIDPKKELESAEEKPVKNVKKPVKKGVKNHGTT